MISMDSTAPRVLLSAWLEELNEDDPACARAVEDRLAALLEHASIEAVGRWILTGLRLHADDRNGRRAYLSLANGPSIESLHREAASGGVERWAPSLGWFLRGLTGRSILIQPLDQGRLYAAPLRPSLTPTHLLLPGDYTVLDGSDRSRLYPRSHGACRGAPAAFASRSSRRQAQTDESCRHLRNRGRAGGTTDAAHLPGHAWVVR